MSRPSRMWIALISLYVSICWNLTTAGDNLDGPEDNSTVSHIFHDPTFWKHFEIKVLSKSWSCNFPSDILLKTIEQDAKLYSDDAVFKKRRHGALQWVKNDTLWNAVVLGACKELADRTKGIYSNQLQDLNILEAFEDYVDHLDYFYRVAAIMKARGHKVKPFSQDWSEIHDIDKLDPIMMIGYSERFEDNVTTSIWDLCVNRHTHVNPHHQAHCIWHDCCIEDCKFCEDIRSRALQEMVCDKVSRRVQKNLDGRMSEEMWDVEATYFAGLPEDCLARAIQLLQSLKKNKSNQ